jgi:hypothetical protein
LILLAGQDLPQNTAHNLPASCLGQVWDDIDCLGRGEGPDALAHLRDELLAQSVTGIVALLQGDKGRDGLARQLIGYTDDSGLANRMMLDQGCFDLGSGQAMTADINYIINAATDPVEALVITSSAVTGELIQNHVSFSTISY